MLRGALIAASLLAASPNAGAAPADPAVRIADTDPLVVRGYRFGAGERVTVRAIVRGRARQARVIRANPDGAFKTTFASLSATNCDAFTIRALGWRGTRATYVQHPPPCGPGP